MEIPHPDSDRRNSGHGHKISFLRVGLRDFEKVSAAYGDDIAMAALRRVSRLLRQNLRHRDLIIYEGGGMFSVMLVAGQQMAESAPVLRRLQLILDRDLIVTIGRERIRVKGTVELSAAENLITSFDNSKQISVFDEARRERL